MLPKVCRTENAELMRDGGSWAATFWDEAGGRYVLFFQILPKAERDAAHYHAPPVLIDCDPSKRPLNTKGRTYSVLCGPWTPLSWRDARELLKGIAAYKPNESATLRTVCFEKWLFGMTEAADREGAPPASTD
jgi:hypothetical protein